MSMVAQVFRDEGSPRVGEGDSMGAPVDRLAYPPEVYEVADFLHRVYAWSGDNLAELMAAAVAAVVLAAIYVTLRGASGHKLGES